MLTTSYSLLERLRQPQAEGAAWERFIRLYTELLYGWVRGLGLQPADSTDVVQDILVVLLRKLPEYQPTGGARFRGWLWGITRNHVRAFRRQRLPTSVGEDFGPLEPQAPDELDEQHAAEESKLLIRRAAELLQDEFQPATWQAFWRTAVDGRSGREVARELGLSVGAVYAARFRVQRRIRQELAGLLD